MHYQDIVTISSSMESKARAFKTTKQKSFNKKL